MALDPVPAQTWTQTSAPSNEWNSVALSAVCTKLVAVAYGGICTSTNAGVTWASNSLPDYGAGPSVASSTEGNKLVVVNNGGQIFTSTDSGTTWASNSLPGQVLQAVASSADGTRLVTVAYLDGGFSPRRIPGPPGSRPARRQQLDLSVASSADGTRLAATVANIPCLARSTHPQTRVPPGRERAHPAIIGSPSPRPLMVASWRRSVGPFS